MTAARKGRVGRPRMLTREQVVEAALRLGLEDFTMKAVAAELGVTIATLYKYVQDRDELFRLAVGETMARMPLPVDHGQHWSQFLREFAAAILAIMIADRSVLDRLMHWGVGLETELKLSEIFIEAMAKRGFEPTEAARIMRLAGAAAFGAAVRTYCNQARAERSGSLGLAVAEALAHFEADELPLVRAAPFEPLGGGLSLLGMMIEPLIEQIARQRGETLPPAGTAGAGPDAPSVAAPCADPPPPRCGGGSQGPQPRVSSTPGMSPAARQASRKRT
jgi:AcrR family transcriptional regulator